MVVLEKVISRLSKDRINIVEGLGLSNLL